MDLARVMQRLYDSEINVAISCLWDGGWDVRLGDEMNGWKAEATFHPSNGASPETYEHARAWRTLGDAAAWLDGAAREHYPDSTYARTPWCCFVGCDEVAVFELLTVRSTPEGEATAGPDMYSDDTHACEEHVGELLSFQPDAVDVARIYWRVSPLGDRRFMPNILNDLSPTDDGYGESWKVVNFFDSNEVRFTGSFGDCESYIRGMADPVMPSV